MARTRTPGIRVDRDGRRIIDKNHRGVAIYLRLGRISQEHAEQTLAGEIAKVNADLERNAHPRRSLEVVRVILNRAARGSCARSRPQRIRDSAQGVQIQPRTRSGSERRRMVNCPGAARPASNLGLPLPWPMRQYNE